jgi:hypothetical protein
VQNAGDVIYTQEEDATGGPECPVGSVGLQDRMRIHQPCRGAEYAGHGERNFSAKWLQQVDSAFASVVARQRHVSLAGYLLESGTEYNTYLERRFENYGKSTYKHNKSQPCFHYGSSLRF